MFKLIIIICVAAGTQCTRHPADAFSVRSHCEDRGVAIVSTLGSTGYRKMRFVCRQSKAYRERAA